MAQIEILSERDSGSGWLFAIQILNDEGGLSSHQLSLSWADYNLWSSDGRDTPAKVADAVMGFLLSKMPASELPMKFDASIARRRFADADEMIPKLIV